MPTIRAVFPATFKFELVVSRDFYLNKEYQLASALYARLQAMDEDAAIEYLREAVIEVGEGLAAGPEIAE